MSFALLRGANVASSGRFLKTAVSAQSRSYVGASFDQVHSQSVTMHGTTILSVRKNNKVVLIGDGQVTLGSMVAKPNAKKIRKIGDGIVAGFAGGTADAFTLIERLEQKMDEYPGQMKRACTELARDWRMDKFLRRLDATLIVCDANESFTLTGQGDVLEPHDGLIGIGSGGAYALAAARALIDEDHLDAEEIAVRSMKIAGDMCVYSNHNTTMEILEREEPEVAADSKAEECPAESVLEDCTDRGDNF